ncbi:MAG: ankyrin repeat domain-containing protein [Simkaniaceae bacterium]|nr:ankyrin repeat domain-containing protein [Simkaniaceae bacterium]
MCVSFAVCVFFLRQYCVAQGGVKDSPSPSVADTSSTGKTENFSIGYFGRYVLAGFVSGAAVGATIGKAVTRLPGTSVGATIGKAVAYLPETSAGVTIGKVVAYLARTPVGARVGTAVASFPETSVGVTIGKAVTCLPGTWRGAAIGATCGAVTGLLLHRALRGRERGPHTSPARPTADEKGLTQLARTVTKGNVEEVRQLVESGSFDRVDLVRRDARGEIPFLQACRIGDMPIARLLYELNKPNEADMSGACILAAGEGHENIVSWLLVSCGAEVDRPDDFGMTALMVASRGGHCNTIRLLIDRGALINKTNPQGADITAFGCACANGHMDAAQLLYDKGMEREGQVKGKGSALESVAREGRTEIVRWLIDHLGVKSSGKHAEVALGWAALKGHRNVVRRLLSDKKLCVNTKVGCDGWTPFLAVCDNGDTETAGLLYERNRHVIANTNADGDTALIRATVNGRVETVRWLIGTCGVDVLREQKDGWSAFWFACSRGYTDIIEELLPHVQNLIFEISRADNRTCTLFGTMAYAGCTEAIRLFLKTDPTLGGMLKRSGKQKWPPLTLASRQGHPKIVELLLDAGAPVNDAVFQGYTALSNAAERGYTEIVRLLIRRGADVDPYPTDPGESSPIILAAAGGHTEIVRLLHEHGADIRRTGCKGCTALSCAEAGGHTATARLVKELLTGGPVDGGGAEKLGKAGLAGDVGEAETLLGEGVDVNVADPTTGKTTLMLAAENGRTAFVRWLLNTPVRADVTRSDKEGCTALMFATKERHRDIVELLVRVDTGTLLLRRSYTGWTALMYAIAGGDREIVELLLSEIRNMQEASRASGGRDATLGVTPLIMEIGSKADHMLSPDKINETLMRAVKEGCADSVRLLIQQGADVNHRDATGNTPVILAASRGYEAIVRLLLEARADPTLWNDAGRTASSAARTHKYDPIAELIDALPTETSFPEILKQRCVRSLHKLHAALFAKRQQTPDACTGHVSQRWVEQSPDTSRTVKDQR